MSQLTEHYRLLLGLDAAWEVSEVSLSLEEKRVEISLMHLGGRVTCPECGAECSIADHAPERNLASPGHDAVRDTTPCPDAPRQLQGVRREDHARSLGG